MAVALTRGQRLKLADLFSENTLFSIGLTAEGGGITCDFACFGLNGAEKLADERYMTFFNQPTSPCGGVKLISSPGDQAGFAFDLSKLPSNIERFSVTASVDGLGGMAQLRSGHLRLLAGGSEVARFTFRGEDFAQERALMLGELYRKDGVWRLSVTGQGFDGGLSALVKHFGGTVNELHPTSSPPPTKQPSPTTVPFQPPPPRLSLNKITLDKKGESLSLEKKPGGFSKIKINLNWSRTVQKKTGLWGSNQSKGVDLDLGCFIEMKNGNRDVVQTLGQRFGSLDNPPYIKLSGDDRTGDVTEGEDLFINGQRWNELKKILVYAFIYEGVSNWDATNAVVSITVQGEPPLEVGLTHGQNDRGMCAIALLENVNGSIIVTKLAEYFQGHSNMDKHYGWGFSWKHGSK